MTPDRLPLPASKRDGAIVLVHGAWVGEWSWLPIVPLLEASGRPVHNVSLTGHGARRHQGGPHVCLADHVDDVCGVIETFDLTNVTLVGHSYGGRVITQAVQRVADRVRSMVYLDAHTPVADDPGQDPERIAIVAANGGMLPFANYGPTVELLGSQAAVDWFLARTVAQPFRCLTDPWVAPLPDHVTKTFVYALANIPSRFEQYAEITKADASWRYYELDGPHFLMASHPNEVATIILGADSSATDSSATDNSATT